MRCGALSGERGIGGFLVEGEVRGFSTFEGSRAAHTVVTGERGGVQSTKGWGAA